MRREFLLNTMVKVAVCLAIILITFIIVGKFIRFIMSGFGDF